MITIKCIPQMFSGRYLPAERSQNWILFETFFWAKQVAVTKEKINKNTSDKTTARKVYVNSVCDLKLTLMKVDL